MSEGTSSHSLVRSSPSRYCYYYYYNKEDCTGGGDRADGGRYPTRVRATPLALSFFVFVFVDNGKDHDDGKEDRDDGGESRTVRCGGYARTVRFDIRPSMMEGPRRYPRLFLRRRRQLQPRRL